jgi:hypothetical protein
LSIDDDLIGEEDDLNEDFDNVSPSLREDDEKDI